jgi:hypothetical protein
VVFLCFERPNHRTGRLQDATLQIVRDHPQRGGRPTRCERLIAGPLPVARACTLHVLVVHAGGRRAW